MSQLLDSSASGAIQKDQGMGDVYERAYTWLETLKDSFGFRLVDGQEPSLIDICCVILILEGLGKLQDLSQQERAAWGSYIQGCQKVDSGLFADPLWQDSSMATGLSTVSSMYQMTCFALQALDALGVRAPYRLVFMDKFSGAKAVIAWLEELHGATGWLRSDEIMCILAFLVYQAEIEQDQAAVTSFYTILDWLDRTQDGETGLWGFKKDSSLLEAVVITDCFIPFYDYVRRPIRRLTYIIDAMLHYQRADGSLGALLGGGANQNLAVINVLAVAAQHGSVRQDDIKRALIHSYWTIQAMPIKDRAENSQLSLETELSRPPITNWFRLMALAVIEQRYPDDLPHSGRWQFRPWPGRGYHHPGNSLSDHEREVLPLWLRHLSQPAPLAVYQGDEPPMVSVVIPCYNLGRYLPETVESVLVQTMPAFEVIIVNDGSTDEFTNLLLRHLNHPKVRVIHQANQGPAAALNCGIRAARGRYICSLDSDDRLRPEYLEKMSAVLEAQLGVGLVTSYYQQFDCGDRLVQPAACTLPEILVQNEFASASLFRRDAWEKAGGYATSLSGFQDWNMWISILELGYRAEVIPEVLVEYRVRSNSLYHGTTSRPENFGRLLGEIARLHESTYRQNMVEVMTRVGFQTGHSARVFKELSWWIKEQDWAKAWLEEQAAKWQQEAEKRGQVIQEQQAWIDELEGGKAWLEEQRNNWQRLAEEREQIIQKQQADISQLERGKTWLATILNQRKTRR